MEKQIINCLNTQYGFSVTTCTFLSVGADVDACIYKVMTLDQTTYFVKLKRGRHDSSANLQFLLHDTGIKEIICPIKTLDGQLCVYIDDFPLTVYPFIEGHDGFSRLLTDDQWIMLGKALKQIHQLQLPGSVTRTIKKESYVSDSIAQVRSIYERSGSIQCSDEPALSFMNTMQEHKAAILNLANRVEKLVDIVRNLSVVEVLCHGDIHAGNVFITESGTLYIVDWDQPIIAPKERDLMFIGAGVGNVWNVQREIELFYIGYGKTEVNTKLIDYYRYERILQDIVEYYGELILSSGCYKDRLVSYNHFLAMFAPNGVVDIATNSF